MVLTEARDSSIPQPEHWPHISPDSIVAKVNGIFGGVDTYRIGLYRSGDLEIAVTEEGDPDGKRDILAVAKRGDVKVAEVLHVTGGEFHRLYGNNDGIDTSLEVVPAGGGSRPTILFRPAQLETELVMGPVSDEFIVESVDLLLAS